MDDELRYDVMVEGALRRVVSDTLKIVAERGLPGGHHFYISFKTDFPGVQIPATLREQYPKEMTIVLQYQYYGLVVNQDHFMITLSFNSVKERLVIPLEAITTFADPSVNFALQFQTVDEDEDEDDDDGDFIESESDLTIGTSSKAKAKAKTKTDKKSDDKEEKGVVVSLDQFRKKAEKEE